jgi:cytochrome P450
LTAPRATGSVVGWIRAKGQLTMGQETVTTEPGTDAGAAVHRTVLPDGRPVWLVTGYAQARSLLNDARLSNDTAKMGDKAPLAALPDEVKSVVARDMLNTDPPVHTRTRRLAATTFTHRRISTFGPRLERITGELLDTFAGRDEIEVIEDFAGPLSTLALADLIGIPAEDARTVYHYSDMFVTELLSPSEKLLHATASLVEYARELVVRKRNNPGDDLITRLSAPLDSGERLDDDEVSSMVFILLIAGQTATAQLTAKSLYLLLTHPGQLDLLRSDWSLLPSAVEEFLRFDPPLRVSGFRMAREPIEIDGVTIPAGDIVICSILDGNHDAARFPVPGRLDIRRRDNQHLAFGHGLHRCLGGNLAELQAQVGIRSFLDRFPRARLAVAVEDLTWLEAGIMRKLVELPVRLR